MANKLKKFHDPNDYDFKWIKMMRNGYCCRCYRDLIQDKDEILRFKNRQGNGDVIIMCKECATKLKEFLGENIK